MLTTSPSWVMATRVCRVSSKPRQVALTIHPLRPAAVAAAAKFIRGMAERGITCLVGAEDRERLVEVIGEELLGNLDSEPVECELMSSLAATETSCGPPNGRCRAMSP